MTVTKEKNGDVLNVTIEGQLDIKTSPELKAALEGELDDVMTLFFDMKGVSYISSAGLRVLLGAYQVLDEKDGNMILKNVDDSFMEILEMTGFTEFITIE